MPIHSSLLAKPRLLKKLKAFYDHLQKNDGKIGTFRRGIEMNYNNACNLRCKYCFTNSPKGEGVKEFLPIKKIKLILFRITYWTLISKHKTHKIIVIFTNKQ